MRRLRETQWTNRSATPWFLGRDLRATRFLIEAVISLNGDCSSSKILH